MASKRREKKKRFAIALLLFLTIISIVSMLMSLREQPLPKPDITPLLEVAKVMAEETSALLENQEPGPIVLVTTDADFYKPQTEAFQSALKIGRKPSATVENLKPEQLHQASMAGEMSLELFLAILNKHPDAAVIVSFVALPALQDSDLAKLPPHIPKLVVFAPMGTGVKKLLQKKIVQVSVVSRMGPPPRPQGPRGPPPSPIAKGAPPPNPAKTMSARETFNLRYQILTPNSDLTTLPDPPRPPSPPPSPPK